MEATCQEVRQMQTMILMFARRIDEIKKYPLPVTQIGQEEFDSKVRVEAFRLSFDRDWWFLCKWIPLRFYFDDRDNKALIMTTHGGQNYLNQAMPHLFGNKKGSISDAIMDKEL